MTLLITCSNVLQFLGYNQRIQEKQFKHIPEYYDSERRKLQRLSWQVAELVDGTFPQLVLRVLQPIVFPKWAYRHLNMYANGSEYYFIDATMSEQARESLLQECSEQMGETNVKLFAPQDYSWVQEVNDMQLFLQSLRMVSFAEQQFGDISDKDQCIRVICAQ